MRQAPSQARRRKEDEMTQNHTANKWTTTANLTGGQINALRNEAAAAGDLETVKICDRASNGSKRAYAQVARIIRNNEAQP